MKTFDELFEEAVAIAKKVRWLGHLGVGWQEDIPEKDQGEGWSAWAVFPSFTIRTDGAWNTPRHAIEDLIRLLKAELEKKEKK